ncbi:hypothetical protein ACHAW6_014175 [Cyclotella cf. meneghiniana]
MADFYYYCFVKHSVKDKEGWAGFFAQFTKLYADKGMTIDKALQNPDWEGNRCLLTFNSADGDGTCCLWKAPKKSLQEFQNFIDHFTGDAVTNKSYVMEGGCRLKQLMAHGYIRDLINASQDRSTPGLLHGDKFWMTINNNCTIPSDCKMIFEKGCGSAMTLLLSDDASDCFECTPKDMMKEEFQNICDKFTKVTAVNTIWLINDEQSCNVINL